MAKVAAPKKKHLYNPLDTTQKPRVDPSWILLRGLRAYDKYLTGRRDIVRLQENPYIVPGIHVGNLAFGMSRRLWLHTLCGVTYAVYPDPLTRDIRHDVAILDKHPSGAMHCVPCHEWEPAPDELAAIQEVAA